MYYIPLTSRKTILVSKVIPRFSTEGCDFDSLKLNINLKLLKKLRKTVVTDIIFIVRQTKTLVNLNKMLVINTKMQL